MADFLPGEQGRVVRIIDGDAFVLDTGQSVRLVSIEAPAPERRNRPGQPYAEEASRILEDLVLGREVRLYYAGLSRDRYDRALAHAVTIDNRGPTVWLNQALVARGAARVRVYPDTARGAAQLLETEAAARAEGRGLWELRAYAIRRATAHQDEAPGFTIVEGVLGEVQAGRDAASPSASERFRRVRPTLCARPLLGSAIVLEAAPTAPDVCVLDVGERIVARGYMRDGRMEITHRLNLTSMAAGGDGSDSNGPGSGGQDNRRTATPASSVATAGN